MLSIPCKETETHLMLLMICSYCLVQVLLFSFTGDRLGRVIEAYYGGDGLVVHMSNFYSFNVITRRGRMVLFSRYLMSSEINPNAGTKSL
jgi:hypothetical protein